MKEWLLSEEKNKVGRPKLADDSIINKARISICVSLLVCAILCISFIGIVKGESPAKMLYSVSFEKILGKIENSNGFSVKNYYIKNDYVMNITPSRKVQSYQANYKYTLYKLVKNNWIEKKSDVIKKDKKNFKIKIKSSKNKNITWKIKLQVINGSKVNKSYAPAGWQFMNSDEKTSKYAYNVFTVKGYYSPVPNSETDKISTNKINVVTKKNNPRVFILTTPINVDVKTSYTDGNKVIKLKKQTVNEETKIYIPNLARATNVTFKIYANNIKEYKNDNWSISEDGKYIKNTYLLKPESAYTNK